jgi:hypothetical protein
MLDGFHRMDEHPHRGREEPPGADGAADGLYADFFGAQTVAVRRTRTT